MKLEEINIGFKLLALIVLCSILIFLKEFVSVLMLFVFVFGISVYFGIVKNYKLLIILFLAPVVIFVITKNPQHSLMWFKSVLKLVILLLSGWLFASTSDGHDLVKVFHKLKFPKNISFMLGVSLRFIPKIVSEYKDILSVIKNRFDLSSSKALKHYKDYMRIFMIPIVIRCVSMADEIAQAAELKGFGSPNKKLYTKLYIKKQDYVFIIGFMAFMIIIISIEYLLRRA